MGWFDGFKRIKDPVRASAHVVSTTRAPYTASSGSCRMHLVVSVPGHPNFAVDDEYIVKVTKWPHPGQTLPLEASRSEPTRFKILWDEIADWDVSAAARAQQLAQTMNQGPPPAAPAPAPAPTEDEDRVSALERLAALRASGALTDAEFEAEKARILGS